MAAVHNRLNIAAAAAILSVAVFGFSDIIVDTINPVHKIILSEAVHSDLRPGEKLCLRLQTYRSKICDPKTVRFWLSVDPKTGQRKYVGRSVYPAALGGIGHSDYQSCISEMPDLPPGNYETTGYVVNDCGSRVFSVSIPRVQFRVLEK